MSENNNNNGLMAIGLFAIVSLMIFALVVFSKQESTPIAQQSPVVVNQNNSPPPAPVVINQNTAPQTTVVVPPPVCPPDCDSNLYEMGYEDSSCGRRANWFYRNNVHYMRGYRDGSRFCPPRLRFNINIGH